MRPLSLLLPALVLAPLPAAGQRLPEVLSALRPDQMIRIRTVTHGVHIGRFQRTAADTVYLHPERGSTWVATGAIDALWVRGTAARTGAAVGAISGAVLGGALLAWFVSALCETSNCETVEAAVLGAGFGGAAGALTGLVIGTFVDKWHRRYPP